MSAHLTEIEDSDDGWKVARCSCGWSEGPFPGMSEAADAIMDHGRDVGDASS